MRAEPHEGEWELEREGWEGTAKEGKEDLYELAGRVIGCALRVHSYLGPGLLESAEGLDLDCGFRLDLLIEGKLVVEVKAISQLLPLHIAQLRTYLRLSGTNCGLLINFNTRHLRDGIRQIYA